MITRVDQAERRLCPVLIERDRIPVGKHSTVEVSKYSAICCITGVMSDILSASAESAGEGVPTLKSLAIIAILQDGLATSESRGPERHRKVLRMRGARPSVNPNSRNEGQLLAHQSAAKIGQSETVGRDDDVHRFARSYSAIYGDSQLNDPTIVSRKPDDENQFACRIVSQHGNRVLEKSCKSCPLITSQCVTCLRVAPRFRPADQPSLNNKFGRLWRCACCLQRLNDFGRDCTCKPVVMLLATLNRRQPVSPGQLNWRLQVCP